MQVCNRKDVDPKEKEANQDSQNWSVLTTMSKRMLHQKQICYMYINAVFSHPFLFTVIFFRILVPDLIKKVEFST